MRIIYRIRRKSDGAYAIDTGGRRFFSLTGNYRTWTSLGSLSMHIIHNVDYYVEQGAEIVQIETTEKIVDNIDIVERVAEIKERSKERRNRETRQRRRRYGN